MASNRINRVVIGVVAPLLAGGAIAAQAGTAQAAQAAEAAKAAQAAQAARADTAYRAPVFVSPAAGPGGTGQSCNTAEFSSIQSAVDAAPSGGSVVLCAGTYSEQVVIDKPLTLTGQNATIDETGVTPSLRLDGQTISAGVVLLSSDIRFTGVTVQHARGDGILAVGLNGDISKITVTQSTIVDNGRQGLYLTGVVSSTIEHDTVSGNSGGILLTDNTGPTHNNMVDNNVISDNTEGSGIIVPGDNPDALTAGGQPQPSVAGVYRNTFEHNEVTGNAGGVLFDNTAAGTASYDNVVENNYLAGNGLSGVTMHAGPIGPGQFEDLSGNQLSGNVIGTNNLNGDDLSHTAADLVTTGILVFSAGTPVSVGIQNNRISGDTVGIWLSQAVTVTGLNSNTYVGVTTPVSANH